MTDWLARVLAAAFPDSDPEHLAEAVWLAARWAEPAGHSADSLGSRDEGRPATDDGEPEPGASPSDSPADLALSAEDPGPHARGAARVTEVGLRLPATLSPTRTTANALSLFRRTHRPGRPEVDVDATVEATADAQRLVVVSRPGHERGLDAAIVVDPTPVALAWADTIAEFEGTLRRTGAFRSVTHWTLDDSARTGSGEPLIQDNAGVVHHADQLVDLAGRRLVLIFTDGTGDAWRRDGTWQVLRRWAWAMPTTVVHLLPPAYWGYTAIGQPTSVVRSLRPADANVSLETRSAWWNDDAAPTDVPVPVIELDPDAIVRWSRAIVSGNTWTDAVWARRPLLFTDTATGDALTTENRVATFEMRASTGAQRLARILAGAPLLSLPLIRVLHRHLVAGPATSQIAELLVSGLLERIPEEAGPGDPLLTFRPGVAELLYRGTTITQEWDVYDLLTGYLERNAGSGDAVRALVADPDGAVTVGSDLVPFAAMGRRMALRLGLDLALGEPATASASGDAFNAHVEAGGGPRRYLLLCSVGSFESTGISPIPHESEMGKLNELFTSLGYMPVPIPSGFATRAAVLAALERFYQDPDRRFDDLVVLYLSGHGAVADGEFRFLTSDTQPDNIAGTSISSVAVARLIFRGSRTSRTLVVIDSSHAGLAARELVSAAHRRSDARALFGVLASASEREPALVDAFTNAFISTVRGWLDNSVEPSLPLREFIHGLKERLRISADQHPELRTVNDLDSEGSAYLVRPASRAVRSMYLDHVRRVAPQELIGRDDDLALLADFCAGRDRESSYLMVEGEPGAGKSALLASFVLAPPTETGVVSFFVTSRLAGNDDREGFVEVVIQQLAEMLGRSLPARSAEPAREQHLRDLLDRAARTCNQEGRRLVLVVDGIDEDRGVRGPVPNSIAALLPASPSAGMRIIVAARAHWQIPDDVAGDHQLRNPQILRLRPQRQAVEEPSEAPQVAATAIPNPNSNPTFIVDDPDPDQRQDWGRFDSFGSDDPELFYQRRFRELHSYDESIIRIVADFFTDANTRSRPPIRGIDIGTGVNLYPALLMLPFASEIVLYEKSFHRRQWLGAQLPRPDESWLEFWSAIRGERLPYQSIKDPFDLLGQRARVAKGNIFSLRPNQFNIGTMLFQAELITTRDDEFERAVQSFVSCLVPRAPFAAAFMRNFSGFFTSDRKAVPTCTVDERDVRRVLEPVATDVRIHVVDDDIDTADGGIIVATGRKRS